jgi:predicted phosphate transport protein (TIGR00153 family)|tara:strand:- start:3518 stop:4192 length:675 start_codon:yes stop_codon:yes gene_type:complete
MGNYFSGIFGPSPISPLQAHMAKVQSCIEELIPFFEAVIKGDFDSATASHQAISTLEKEADKLKKELRIRLPSGLFLPFSRSDLLNVLTMQDSIANKAKDISGTVVSRQIKLPDPIDSSFVQFVSRSVDASAQAQTAINELDELVETGFRGGEVKLVEKMLTELDRIESDTDHIEAEIRMALFQIEKDLNPVEVIFLYRIIDNTGELADLAQRVGSRLQLMLAR